MVKKEYGVEIILKGGLSFHRLNPKKLEDDEILTAHTVKTSIHWTSLIGPYHGVYFYAVRHPAVYDCHHSKSKARQRDRGFGRSTANVKPKAHERSTFDLTRDFSRFPFHSKHVAPDFGCTHVWWTGRD